MEEIRLNDWIQVFAAVGILATAVFTYRVAKATKGAVEAQKKGIAAQAISSLIDEYAETEMQNALERLADSFRKGQNEFHLKFRTHRFVPAGWDAHNNARRRIHWYYKKCYELWHVGLIGDEFMRDFVADTNGYSVFHDIVARMSRDIDPSSDPARLAWIDRLREVFPPRPFE